jgi:hypothetical protein
MTLSQKKTTPESKQFTYPEVKGLKPKYQKMSDVIMGHMDTYFKGLTPTAPAPIKTSEDGKKSIVLVLSDTHFGKLTPTFNHKAHALRGQSLFDEAYRRSKDPKVDEIVIAMLGDHVEGERLFPNQWREIEYPVVEQYLKVAELFSSWILGLSKASRKPIRVYCTPGNHGRLSYKNDDFDWKANWDMFAFHLISKILQPHKIPVRIMDSWDGAMPVKNKTFLITHGDKIQGGGDPATIEKSFEGWSTSLGWHWDAAILGHYHAPKILGAHGKPIFINGCWPSNDPYTTGTIKKYCPATSKILTVSNERAIDCIDFYLEDK